MSKAEFISRGLDRKLIKKLIISDEAMLWLGRLCYGEGGTQCGRLKAQALLWAFLNRYMYHPAREKWVELAKKYNAMPESGDEFIAVMRMFSQPINPRWARGGDKVKKITGTKLEKRFAGTLRLDRRDRVTNAAWIDLSPTIRRAVTEFANGVLHPPSKFYTLRHKRCSDWASIGAIPSTPKKFPWGVLIKGDWFFENKALIKGRITIKTDKCKITV